MKRGCRGGGWTLSPHTAWKSLRDNTKKTLSSPSPLQDGDLISERLETFRSSQWSDESSHFLWNLQGLPSPFPSPPFLFFHARTKGKKRSNQVSAKNTWHHSINIVGGGAKIVKLKGLLTFFSLFQKRQASSCCAKYCNINILGFGLGFLENRNRNFGLGSPNEKTETEKNP